jgi:hypothetical protein
MESDGAREGLRGENVFIASAISGSTYGYFLPPYLSSLTFPPSDVVSDDAIENLGTADLWFTLRPLLGVIANNSPIDIAKQLNPRLVAGNLQKGHVLAKALATAQRAHIDSASARRLHRRVMGY